MKNRTVLFIGDLLALAIVTVIGFTTHGEAGAAFLPRMAAAWLPLSISWFAIAPFFGLFSSGTTTDLKQLWRPALAMFFAGPLAVVMRGLILNAPIIPIFGVVLSLTSALGVVIWRAVYLIIDRRTGREHRN